MLYLPWFFLSAYEGPVIVKLFLFFVVAFPFTYPVIVYLWGWASVLSGEHLVIREERFWQMVGLSLVYSFPPVIWGGGGIWLYFVPTLAVTVVYGLVCRESFRKVSDRYEPGEREVVLRRSSLVRYGLVVAVYFGLGVAMVRWVDTHHFPLA